MSQTEVHEIDTSRQFEIQTAWVEQSTVLESALGQTFQQLQRSWCRIVQTLALSQAIITIAEAR